MWVSLSSAWSITPPSLSMAIRHSSLRHLNRTWIVLDWTIRWRLWVGRGVSRSIEIFFPGRSVCMDKECSRSRPGRLFLGLFNHGSAGWLSRRSIRGTIHLRWSNDHRWNLLDTDACWSRFTLGRVVGLAIRRWTRAWSDMAQYDRDHVSLGTTEWTRKTYRFHECR